MSVIDLQSAKLLLNMSEYHIITKHNYERPNLKDQSKKSAFLSQFDFLDSLLF